MKRIVEHGENSASSPVPPQPYNRKNDTLSRPGAMALAQQLQDYWHSRGYKGARFWVEPVTERFGKLGTHEVHRVVCNLVNALPPRLQE